MLAHRTRHEIGFHPDVIGGECRTHAPRRSIESAAPYEQRSVLTVRIAATTTGHTIRPTRAPRDRAGKTLPFPDARKALGEDARGFVGWLHTWP
jgi:hypothetical protein